MRFIDVEGEKCRKCGHCEDVCPTGAIRRVNPSSRWVEHHIPEPEYCINCGQCLKNCPGGAIYECVSYIDAVRGKIDDGGTLTVAMTAPSIRYSLAREFGMKPGTYIGGKVNAALRRLGFDRVWDVEFGADMTVMEESAELIGRIEGTLDRPLPMFTSCCPGWIKYAETYYPELIPHLSSTRSPVQILGVLAKTYGADYIGANPEYMYTTAVMPCIAKKFEGMRDENSKSGYRDTDAVITTRELITMIRSENMDFPSLPEEEADEPFKISTGAATIFCVTGGVMEAVLRRVSEVLNGEPLENVEFAEVRGRDGIREAVIPLGGMDLRVAVVSGLKNAADICERAAAGESTYDVIEVMACPDGCINGGGQPYEGWDDEGVVAKLMRIGDFFNRKAY